MIKGVGCDIVEIKRINENIAKNILTKEEKLQLETKKNKLQFIASRFCAKEAIIKATNKKYLCKDIIISNKEDGSIHCNIKGVKLSISHEDYYCVAYAIWEDHE